MDHGKWLEQHYRMMAEARREREALMVAVFALVEQAVSPAGGRL
jgi:hypothetical protein